MIHYGITAEHNRFDSFRKESAILVDRSWDVELAASTFLYRIIMNDLNKPMTLFYQRGDTMKRLYEQLDMS